MYHIKRIMKQVEWAPMTPYNGVTVSPERVQELIDEVVDTLRDRFDKLDLASLDPEGYGDTYYVATGDTFVFGSLEVVEGKGFISIEVSTPRASATISL